MKRDGAEPNRITMPVPAPEDEYVASAYTSAAIADVDEGVQEPRRRHSSGLRFAKVPPPPASGVFVATAAAAAPRSDLEEVKRLVCAGEHGRALMVAERALAAPEAADRAALELYAVSARDALAAIYRERLGGGETVLRSRIGDGSSQATGLDAQLAFVLSQVDGRTTVDDLVDLSGMPVLEALRCIHALVRDAFVEPA